MNIHFVTTFSLILTLLFTLSLYWFGFHANTYFVFVNYGCHISCQPNGCSNNTPLDEGHGLEPCSYHSVYQFCLFCQFWKIGEVNVKYVFLEKTCTQKQGLEVRGYKR